jgi:hypothetical protein
VFLTLSPEEQDGCQLEKSNIFKHLIKIKPNSEQDFAWGQAKNRPTSESLLTQ